ncbi:MAG: type II toxin-antitoxin system RelE/ParE family toxin [Luteimonas sp.]
MSHASPRAEPAAPDRIERAQPWTAALVTVLLHALVLLLVLLTSPLDMTPPQGGSAAAGGGLEVTYIDDTIESPPPPVRPTPPRPKPTQPTPRPVTPPPAASRLQLTEALSNDPQPPDNDGTAHVVAAPPEEAAPPTATADVPPPPTQRPAQLRGQPPGMRMEDLPPSNSRGMAAITTANRGRGSEPAPDSASMEVDGYAVYYDLFSERTLREWRDQGITELFLPLPGTKRLMVCPLEVALRRGSSACRMIEPDSPERAKLGDARQAINMQQVRRLGEVVWRGPGPYR